MPCSFKNAVIAHRPGNLGKLVSLVDDDFKCTFILFLVDKTYHTVFPEEKLLYGFLCHAVLILCARYDVSPVVLTAMKLANGAAGKPPHGCVKEPSPQDTLKARVVADFERR
jgi:hypothetical protein